MKKRRISDGWIFSNLTRGTAPETVDLPHDYQIKEARDPEVSINNGAYPDTVGKYLKYLRLKGNTHYVLDIDGAYMCAHVSFNEEQLAIHPYGYTPFLVDLTPYVFDGITNKISIITTPMKDSTRWYSGNGLYRDVFLWEGGDIRIEPWDLFVSTLDVADGVASVRVRYTVSADYAASVKLFVSVVGEDCSATLALDVKEGKNDGETVIRIKNPKLWEPGSPSLYTLTTEISVGGQVLDTSETVFGIRTVSADAEHGLVLNGKPIKLRGGCIHHDNGELGAAAFPAAEERKIRKLMAAGFNAIRTAHNPPSLAMLEVCDRLGMIVMDEAFDVWNIMKCKYDYHIFFRDWWARDLSYMVLRDRNHPSVFSYSIGNEMYEMNGTSKHGEWSKMLADEVRKYDDTRFVTSGIQKVFTRKFDFDSTDPEDYAGYFGKLFNERKESDVEVNRVTAPYEQPLDIIGANYYYDRYTVDHAMYPDRVIWGSETRAIEFFRSWGEVMKHSYVIGDFTWTAYDNIGEAGAGRFAWKRDVGDGGVTLYGAKYPWRNCYQGDFDLAGFRRPQSYFRESLWRADSEPRIFTTHPEHFGEEFFGTKWHWYDVSECWSFDPKYEGKPIKAQTYTTADKVCWYVNGRFVGESSPIEGIASIETVYERGNIRAVAYRDGEQYSEFTLWTTDGAERIGLSVERSEIAADGRDLGFVELTLTDASGRAVTNDDRVLTAEILGGELVAFFSGDPMSEHIANDMVSSSYSGHALIVVRTKDRGKVTVKVTSSGLIASEVEILAR